MKLVIKNEYFLEDTAELTAIPSGSIQNHTQKWINSSFQGFQYLTITQQGVYRPNDIVGEKGYWKSDSQYVFEKSILIVDENYDIVSNNCTDITTPMYVNYAFELELIDYLLARDMIKDHCIDNWDSYSFTDKKIITSYHLWPSDGGTSGHYNGTNGLWHEKIINEYWTDDERRYILAKMIVKTREAKEERLKSLLIEIGMMHHDLNISLYEVGEFYKRISTLLQTWKMICETTRIYDWIEGTGIYEEEENIGYPDEPFYSEKIKNVAIKILKDGDYKIWDIDNTVII
jgi:hypothetical protein